MAVITAMNINYRLLEIVFRIGYRQLQIKLCILFCKWKQARGRVFQRFYVDKSRAEVVFVVLWRFDRRYHGYKRYALKEYKTYNEVVESCRIVPKS